MNTYEEELRIVNLTHDEIVNIKKMLPNKLLHEYANFKAGCLRVVPDDMIAWRNSYNNIKDPSWPNCNSILDFDNLPIDIQNECRTVHKFSPELYFNKDMTYDQWTPDEKFDYTVSGLVRTKNIILDNLEFITNKNLIDIGCHIGDMSYYSLYHGARSVLATNIRSEYLDIAKEYLGLAGYTDQFTTQLADIHNYRATTELVQGKDTVLFLGLLYHIHDHYSVLESITRAGPTTIIIETCQDPAIVNDPNPLIFWGTEPTENPWHGWYESNSRCLVGFPNPSWIDLAMNTLGYSKVKETHYKSSLTDHKKCWQEPLTDKDSSVELPPVVKSRNLNDFYSQSVHVYNLKK